MAKLHAKTSKKNVGKEADQSDHHQLDESTFTLTFAIEILGVDVWHDCNEGWLDLGPCTKGMKIQYQIYQGQSYDLDILIWPHVAKIFYGANYGWVRTWQFLDRRWLTFGINHLFPVRVVELRNFVAIVNPSTGLGVLSASAKGDKPVEVYLPPLAFGERRYFASIQEAEITIQQFMQNIIVEILERFIPASIKDGLFDVPYPLSDIRCQDAILYHVKETILSRDIPRHSVDDLGPGTESKYRLYERKLSTKSDTKRKAEVIHKIKFEMFLPGSTILAGTGRQVPFTCVGDRPDGLGEIITLIASNNLPAADDNSMIFVNIDTLFDVPVGKFKELKIVQLYTKWSVGEDEFISEPQLLTNKREMKFNHHDAAILKCEMASAILSGFSDTDFEIQLRGIRKITKIKDPTFFGYDKADRDFATNPPPKLPNVETDVIIATTHIDAKALARGFNCSISGEFDLYPPTLVVADLGREAVCTNDMNRVRALVKPELVVQPYVILEAQMTLQVSMGFVGCRPQSYQRSFSRIFCLITESDVIIAMLKLVSELNEEMAAAEGMEMNDELLTGFALDVGDKVIFYAEGVRHGAILKVWEQTEDFYPYVKPIFSTSSRYLSRLYPSLLNTAVPFVVLKMCVPLSALLACPLVYVRPALPILTRSAALKLGRIVAAKQRAMPSRAEMPTPEELISFRLELCVPPRPINALPVENSLVRTSTAIIDARSRGDLGEGPLQQWNTYAGRGKKEFNKASCLSDNIIFVITITK